MSSSCSFEILTGCLEDYLANDIPKKEYDDSAMATGLALISPKEVTKILNFIFAQPSYSQPNWSIYTANILSQQTNLYIDYINNDYEDNCTLYVKYEDAHLTADLPNVQNLGQYLLNENMNRYVYFPIVFSIPSDNIAHYSVLIFDLHIKQVFLVDPNGNNSFFSKYLGQESELLMDKLFVTYINDMNIVHDIGLEYVPQYTWNPTGRIINRKLNNLLVSDKGNCVILTIMLSHFLSLTQATLDCIFDIFDKLHDDELSIIINMYSKNIFNIIDNDNAYIKKYNLLHPFPVTENVLPIKVC